MSSSKFEVSMISPSLPIPELFKLIKYSFRECDFNEVENVLIDREKNMRFKIENLGRDLYSIKEEVIIEGFGEFENAKALYEKVCEEKSKMESEKNEIISGLNEQINGLKKRNMESEQLLRVYQDKFKDLNARVVKMGEEVKNLKAAQVNTNLLVVDAGMEGGNVKFQDYEGEKGISGNGRIQEGRNVDAIGSGCIESEKKGSADSRDEGKDDYNNKKKKRALVGQSKTRGSCRVPGCNADITDESQNSYHRDKICRFHAKADVVLLAGVEQRFCQRCNRFHELSEFDEAKRGCRASLAKRKRDERHNTIVDDECVGDDDSKKRKRALMGPSKTRGSCRVPGCNADTAVEKPYSHYRKKICGFHAKADVVLLAGVEQRFCQNCARFHELSEFDESRRNCRIILAKKKNALSIAAQVRREFETERI